MSTEEAYQRGKHGYDSTPPSHYDSAQRIAWQRGRSNRTTGPTLYNTIEGIVDGTAEIGHRLMLRLPSAYSIIIFPCLLISLRSKARFSHHVPSFLALAVLVLTIRYFHKRAEPVILGIQHKGSLTTMITLFLYSPELKKFRIPVAVFTLWYLFS
jgi:hypothetical protein